MSGILQATTSWHPYTGGSLAIDSVSSAEQVGNSPLTWSHTCSGSDRGLIVGVSVFVMDILSVTYNGDALTLIGTGTANGSTKTFLYQLINPDSGTHDIVVTPDGPGLSLSCGGISFTGAHQTTMVGTEATGTGSSTAPSATASSSTGEIVVSNLAWPTGGGDQTAAVDSPSTERWNLHTLGASSTEGAGSTRDGETSTVMAWTMSGSVSWALTSVPVKPA